MSLRAHSVTTAHNPTPGLLAVLAGPRFPAACKGADPQLWYERIDRTETPQQRAERLELARGVCRTCPGIDTCRELRFSNPAHLPGGVWAGEMYNEARLDPERLTVISARTVSGLRQEQGSTAARLPALTHCQNDECGKELTPERQAIGARSCDYTCSKAAERQRRNARYRQQAKAASTPTEREVPAA